MGLGIVVGADIACCDYEETLPKDLSIDEWRNEVIDAVVCAAENTDSPCGAITVNRIPGIRASAARELFSVERLALSNNAQVQLCSPCVIGIDLARRPAKEWLGCRPKPHSAPKSRQSRLTRKNSSLMLVNQPAAIDFNNTFSRGK